MTSCMFNTQTHNICVMCVNRDSKIILHFRIFCCEREKKIRLVSLIWLYLLNLTSLMRNWWTWCTTEKINVHTNFSPQFCKKKINMQLIMQCIFFIFQSSQLVGPKMDQKFVLIWSLTSGKKQHYLQTIKMHLIFKKGETSHCFWVWCQKNKTSQGRKI